MSDQDKDFGTAEDARKVTKKAIEKREKEKRQQLTNTIGHIFTEATKGLYFKDFDPPLCDYQSNELRKLGYKVNHIGRQDDLSTQVSWNKEL